VILNMSDEKKPIILVICGDPGGANAVIPVIKKLNDDNKTKVCVFSYGQASSLMENNDIPTQILEKNPTEFSIPEIIRQNHPSLLLASTSFNPACLEKKFIRSARVFNIPTLAIVDFWSNYSLRFSDNEGVLRFIPDSIAVMDEKAYYDMITEGFNPDALVITGQPAFDALAEIKNTFTKIKRLAIRDLFHVPKNAIFIVFPSQPLSSLYGESDANPHFLGFTEKTVIQKVIPVLEKISRDSNKCISLLIRLHPRESLEDYQHVNSKVIQVVVSQEGNPREIVMASDLVLGMNTELLIEACYLGCIVISIQPGLRGKDPLPTNSLGYSIPVYSESKIHETINTILMDPMKRDEIKHTLNHFKQDGQATRNVVKKIYQMICMQ